MTPPKLTEGHKANFKTLQRAHENGDLCLVSAIRRSDQSPVALVCATQETPEGMVQIVPLAAMCEGNPYENFLNPTL